MAGVQWIKLTVTMFDDEKVKLIQAMPEGDSILVIWIRLLLLAGKINDDGHIYLSGGIPYTEEMLATVFNKPVNIVRLALHTFESLTMVERSSKGIYLPAWDRHQNIEGLDKIREQTRLRVHRHRQKELESGDAESCNVTVALPVTLRNATEKNKNRIDKDINPIGAIAKDVIGYFNEVAGTSYRASGAKTKRLIAARVAEGFTAEDFRAVIEIKCRQWKNTDMAKFIRPETLFGTKFEAYRQEREIENGKREIGNFRSSAELHSEPE